MDYRAGLDSSSTGDICINRTLIKKRLLVEFSCEFPTLYPSLRFTALYYHLSLDKWSS